jgi:hypothetical protein
MAGMVSLSYKTPVQVKKSGVVTTCKTSPRVLLRSITDKLYFAASGAWVSNPGDALDFGETPGAIRFAHKNGFRDVELVFSYANPELDMSFGLQPRKFTEERASILGALGLAPASDLA